MKWTGTHPLTNMTIICMYVDLQKAKVPTKSLGMILKENSQDKIYT